MHTFFHGWRRKAGVVTLGLACMFATGWIRSSHKVELVFFNGVWPNHTLVSGCGRFRILSHQAIELDLDADGNLTKRRASLWFHKRSPVITNGSPEVVAFDCDLVETHDETGHQFPLIPYWSVTLPLTLLSALFLLWPQRRAKPKEHLNA